MRSLIVLILAFLVIYTHQSVSFDWWVYAFFVIGFLLMYHLDELDAKAKFPKPNVPTNPESAVSTENKSAEK